MSEPKLSVVSPVYGCTGCLEELVERVATVVGEITPSFEFILVDDRGPGEAWNRIVELSNRYACVRGVRLSRNFGQHPAITAGLAHSRGDFVVVMDCDLQDVPEEIPKLFKLAEAGADVVLAQRISRQDRLMKRLASKVFYATLAWLTGVPQDPTVANFGIYSRRVVDAVVAFRESSRFFPLLVRWTGFRTLKVPVSHSARSEGSSSYSLSRMLTLAIEVAIAYSDKPLRLSIGMGIVFACFAAIVVAYSVFAYFDGRTSVAGFTSIMASIWLSAAAIQISLGFIGLYLGRIYVEAKSRPIYIVEAMTPERADDQ